MTKLRLFPVCMSIAVIGVLVAPICGFCAQTTVRASSKKPVLRPLVPQEDLSVVPDSADVFDQAVTEYSAGHMPQAAKLFEQVLQLDPKNADAHFNLGAIREWGNDLNSALKHYRAALVLKPNDSELTEAVRSVQFKLKNKTQIDAQVAKQKRDSDLSRHAQIAKETFGSQNYREAVIHLSQLANAMPDDPKIQFALGQSLRALKYYDWAAYRLKMAIFLDPDNDLYRKTLVELDNEMQDVHGKALTVSADMALKKVAPLSFPALAESGVQLNAF